MSNEPKKAAALKRLQSLRNIGPVTAERLYSIGIETPEHMTRSDPEELYETLKNAAGGKLDKCVLYQLRGAVLDLPWWDCKNLTTYPPNQGKRKGAGKR
ncbi:MAG TPA: helix-hairpin-helix domain-containing protein [Desulfobacteria bacterium]|nr:helix-hairpin-helix domain-containing protein [Desulfobacteria bacterium]